MTTNTIKVRNVKFNFDKIEDKHYVHKNIFATHFLNSLHVVFPEGEKFFIRSVRYFTDEIKDPELKRQVREFVGQEGIHHREHERFWDSLEKMGLKPMSFANFLNKTAFDGLERKLLFKIFPDRFAKKLSLSVTTALEHYTALFGGTALQREELKDYMPEEMHLMMQWHAAEELEHKSVCFNVLKEVDDSYALRIGGMLIASTALYFYAFAGMAYFVYVDENKDIKTMPSDLLKFFAGFNMMPRNQESWKILFDYFRRDFHPDDHDNYHLAKEFFEKYDEKLGQRVGVKQKS
jgi:predicted metal-dependent hydrolase